MARLLVGPILRYVSDTDAVLWVETDDPCEVEVLGHRERTFCVAGHHYALVVVDGLEPGSTTEYEIALDGTRRWPEPESEFPPSVIRTLGGDRPVKLAFGSCRVSLPHHAPFTLPKDEHDQAREFDALVSLVQEMRRGAVDDWPLALLMLGDQVYADEVSPETLAFIRKRRDIRNPPWTEVADFEEYTRLYRESWTDPPIRWLLSTVSCSMVIDDHDVHDDWNISAAWVREMRRREWWAERERGALASYWLYQFVGNLSPELLAKNRVLADVRAADDGWKALERYAARERELADGERWSYCRDLDGTRLIVIDSRCGRILDEGRRSILDEAEWQWLEEHLVGDFDHLLIATSDPVVLAPGLHHVERWGEAIHEGAWGRRAAEFAERLRRTMDFDHWAAFGESFERLMALIAACGSGAYGKPPASITLLSGDVHHAYLAELAFPRSAGVRSAVWQAVCSPYRNALDRHERWTIAAGNSRVGSAIGRGLARLAGVHREPVRWRLVEGPFFDNQVATLTIDGRRAAARLERTVGDPESDHRELHLSYRRQLAR
jgi:PhoD-like phosphatase